MKSILKYIVLAIAVSWFASGFAVGVVVDFSLATGAAGVFFVVTGAGWLVRV